MYIFFYDNNTNFEFYDLSNFLEYFYLICFDLHKITLLFVQLILKINIEIIMFS